MFELWVCRGGATNYAEGDFVEGQRGLDRVQDRSAGGSGPLHRPLGRLDRWCKASVSVRLTRVVSRAFVYAISGTSRRTETMVAGPIGRAGARQFQIREKFGFDSRDMLSV